LIIEKSNQQFLILYYECNKISTSHDHILANLDEIIILLFGGMTCLEKRYCSLFNYK